MANTIHAPISYLAILFSMHRSYLFEMMLVKENIDPETKQYFIRCSAIKLSTKCASKKAMSRLSKSVINLFERVNQKNRPSHIS